jgi:LuxR family maltose regulon positive regulatory protein
MSPDQSCARDIPLLRTKISKPRIPTEFVHRSRLTERIDRGIKGQLTLLAVPAGFGKTSLLIEWAEATSLPVAWLTMDSADNDQGRLFRYIIGALQTLEPGLGEEALDYLQSNQGSSDATASGGLEIGLTLLINEIAALPKEIVLVLDDFHVLEVPTMIPSNVLISANHFLKNLPQNLHLVIASRSEPTLDLTFLRSKGLVAEITRMICALLTKKSGISFNR